MQNVVDAFRQSWQLLRSNRSIWIPFLLPAALELLLLVLLWVAPHPPFSLVLAPPVRHFYGEQSLHYPWHLLMLYYAMKQLHMIAMVTIGAFLSGLACAMVAQSRSGKPARLREALVSHRVSYFTMTVLWLAAWAAAKFALEGINQFLPAESPRLTLIASLILMVVLQALFVYAIPVAVYRRASWWKGLSEGVAEAARNPLETLALIALPLGAVIAVGLVLTSARVSRWLLDSQPEWVVVFVVLKLVVWTASDMWMTLCIANAWLQRNSNRVAP